MHHRSDRARAFSLALALLLSRVSFRLGARRAIAGLVGRGGKRERRQKSAQAVICPFVPLVLHKNVLVLSHLHAHWHLHVVFGQCLVLLRKKTKKRKRKKTEQTTDNKPLGRQSRLLTSSQSTARLVEKACISRRYTESIFEI